MTTKMATSALTAAGDTVKTLIDTITTPADAKAIIGVWAYANSGPGMTTLESNSGILELESDDMSLTPLQIPLPVQNMLTGGATALNVQVWPVNIPLPQKQAKIRGYVTMDMAQTVANTARFGFIYDA